LFHPDRSLPEGHNKTPPKSSQKALLGQRAEDMAQRAGSKEYSQSAKLIEDFRDVLLGYQRAGW